VAIEAKESSGKRGGSLQDWVDPEQLKKWTDLFQGSLLIAGLLLYGAVRIAVDAFYGSLGATPDEVGLGYAGTLTRAAIGAVGFGLMVAIFSAAIFAYNAAVRGSRHERAYDVIAWIVVLGGAVVGGGFAAARIGGVSAALLIVPIAWTISAIAAWPKAGAKGRPVIILLVLVFTALIATAALTRGETRAADVLAGEEIDSNAIWTIVPVNASCVDVEWTDNPDDAPDNLGNPLLYLGGADGTALLLAVPKDTDDSPVLFRLQVSSITMTHRVTDNTVACTQESEE
jgi:hypothetical protein